MTKKRTKKTRTLQTFDLGFTATDQLERLKRKSHWTKKAILQHLINAATDDPTVFKI
jgi:hypothetical protein